MHHVVALAIPDVVAFDLAIPAQIFGHRDEAELYSFSVASVEAGRVTTTTGFAIEVDHDLGQLDHADTIVVPGFSREEPVPDTVLDALRMAHDRGARIASVCTGAFALAAAGLLNGRRATTHWRNASTLARQYPLIEVDADVLYVEEPDISTSAGIAAGLDLCLQLVRRDLGESAANRIARRMVTAPHRSGGQAQFIERAALGAGPTLQSVCAWAIDHLDEAITMTELARRATSAPRSFARRFVAETGTSPLRWLTAQRLSRARQLLETTDLPIDTVATLCGLGSSANLRLHFARESSITPSEYRRTFRSAAVNRG
jgi:transcriptional regulator GlxA family with amidase domain